MSKVQIGEIKTTDPHVIKHSTNILTKNVEGDIKLFYINDFLHIV